MSYDIRLCDPVTGDVINLDHPHLMRGGVGVVPHLTAAVCTAQEITENAFRTVHLFRCSLMRAFQSLLHLFITANNRKIFTIKPQASVSRCRNRHSRATVSQTLRPR